MGPGPGHHLGRGHKPQSYPCMVLGSPAPSGVYQNSLKQEMGHTGGRVSVLAELQSCFVVSHPALPGSQPHSLPAGPSKPRARALAAAMPSSLYLGRLVP